VSDTEPAEELIPRIMREYSRRPGGWHILNTPDGDMLIVGPRSAFQLRLIPLSPTDFTGVGVEISPDIEGLSNIRSAPSFGLRPLSDDDLQVLFDAMTGQLTSPDRVEQIIRRDPVAPTEIDAKRYSHVLSGPVLTRPNLSSVDSTLLELRDKLEQSAREIFRRKYPLRSGMYF